MSNGDVNKIQIYILEKFVEVIASALVEQQEKGQINPDTMKSLKQIAKISIMKNEQQRK